MLKIKLITDESTLNNFEYVENKEYTPGYPLTIKFQVIDTQSDHRLIPEDDANLTATFQTRDGSQLVIEGSMIFGQDDKSMWGIELTAEQSNDIIGSNIFIQLDFDGSAATPPDLSTSDDLRVGMAYNILSRVTFDGEC